jgi:hypothetical protein
MAQSHGTQGGSHEQHVKAGEQSHKNTAGSTSHAGEHEQQADGRSAGTQGGTHEQHVKAGQQSHKNS